MAKLKDRVKKLVDQQDIEKLIERTGLKNQTRVNERISNAAKTLPR